MNPQPIGIFDSGVGGLTVLKQLLNRLPAEKMIYLGDTARLPYGIKSRETVVRYSLNNAKFLLQRDVKLLVVACNTASSLALETLKKQFKIPIVGVILPGAKKAAFRSRVNRIGVIGTMATIRSRAYELAIKEYKENTRVFSVSCPLFVSLAEEGWLQDEITLRIAQRYLAPLKEKGVDVLVLGCTHYPLLKPVLSQVMGSGVTLVDSAEEVAMQVEDALKSQGLSASESVKASGVSPTIYLTDCSPHFLELSEKILGFSPTELNYVDVG